MADSLLTRLLLQSLVIFRIAVQHEWFFRNPERFRDLVEIFAAVITGRPRRDFGRRDFGTSARSRPDFGRDKGVWARSCLGPKISAVKILPAENSKLVSRCLLFFKMTSRQEYLSKLSCYCLKSYVKWRHKNETRNKTTSNALENVQQEQFSLIHSRKRISVFEPFLKTIWFMTFD